MIEGKHNVLIDDWTQHKKKWEDAGGTFIVHTSARQSLQELALEAFKYTAEKESHQLRNQI